MSVDYTFLDSETKYELDKLRVAHDRTVSHAYRTRGIASAFDPEIIYNLDAIDVLIDVTTPAHDV